MKETPTKDGSLSPRTREVSAPSQGGVGPLWDNPCQPQEGRIESAEESDPPIVVRDGRADHMAKGWAEGQRKQSTHHGTRNLPVPVSRTLLAIGVNGGFYEPAAGPAARLSEEPCAGKPHAGICEGAAR